MTLNDRNSILQIMSDLHKVAFGYRGNMNYSLMSDAQLQREYDYLVGLVESEMRRETVEKLDAQRRWEKRVARLAQENKT